MVAAHRYSHTLANCESAIHYDRLRLDAAHSENSRLRRIDDRSELIDSEHAEVGDGERRAGVLLGCEPALPRESRKVFRFRGDLSYRFAVSVEDDGRNEPCLSRDSHSDVYPVEMPDTG